jgi:hypothetical protein
MAGAGWYLYARKESYDAERPKSTKKKMLKMTKQSHYVIENKEK